jgi:hypothetical protein
VRVTSSFTMPSPTGSLSVDTRRAAPLGDGEKPLSRTVVRRGERSQHRTYLLRPRGRTARRPHHSRHEHGALAAQRRGPLHPDRGDARATTHSVISVTFGDVALLRRSAARSHNPATISSIVRLCDASAPGAFRRADAIREGLRAPRHTDDGDRYPRNGTLPCNRALARRGSGSRCPH